MNVSGKYCVFFNNENSEKRFFLLEKNGVICNLIMPGNINESYWSCEGNIIRIYNNSMIKTSEYFLNDLKSREYRYETLFYDGQSIFGPKLSLRIVNNRYELWELTTRYRMNIYINQNLLEVGPHTYGMLNIVDYSKGDKVIIGDYCSLANGIKFILRSHNTNLITTYPFDELCCFYSDEKNANSAHVSKNNGKIIIGNDVWIGEDVTFMPGVVVGDGAVIGTGSIVTKNVPDYAIVAGIPAKIVRFRFNEQQIVKLKKIAWWNWNDEKVVKNMDKLTDSNIESFIEKFYVAGDFKDEN